MSHRQSTNQRGATRQHARHNLAHLCPLRRLFDIAKLGVLARRDALDLLDLLALDVHHDACGAGDDATKGDEEACSPGGAIVSSIVVVSNCSVTGTVYGCGRG